MSAVGALWYRRSASQLLHASALMGWPTHHRREHRWPRDPKLLGGPEGPDGLQDPFALGIASSCTQYATTIIARHEHVDILRASRCWLLRSMRACLP